MNPALMGLPAAFGLAGATGLTWEQGEDAYAYENTVLPEYLVPEAALEALSELGLGDGDQNAGDDSEVSGDPHLFVDDELQVSSYPDLPANGAGRTPA